MKLISHVFLLLISAVFSRTTFNEKGDPFEDGYSDLLPPEFFTGNVKHGSRCYEAYINLEKYCAMNSELDRIYLATLLANCHLEAAKRKAIDWHQNHRLRKITSQEYSLVNRYIPAILNVCSKSGHGHYLSLFRVQFEHEKQLAYLIKNLQRTVLKARYVNVQSSNISKRFAHVQSDFKNKASEFFRLLENMKNVREILDIKQRELVNLLKEIENSIEIYKHEKNELSLSLKTFTKQVSKQNKLLETSWKKQLFRINKHQNCSNTSNSNIPKSLTTFLLRYKLFNLYAVLPGLQFLRDMCSITIKSIFTILWVLSYLRESRFLGTWAKSTIMLAQSIISFSFVLLCYQLMRIISYLVMKLKDEGKKLKGAIKSSQVACISHIFPWIAKGNKSCNVKLAEEDVNRLAAVLSQSVGEQLMDLVKNEIYQMQGSEQIASQIENMRNVMEHRVLPLLLDMQLLQDQVLTVVESRPANQNDDLEGNVSIQSYSR